MAERERPYGQPRCPHDRPIDYWCTDCRERAYSYEQRIADLERALRIAHGERCKCEVCCGSAVASQITLAQRNEQLRLAAELTRQTCDHGGPLCLHCHAEFDQAVHQQDARIADLEQRLTTVERIALAALDDVAVAKPVSAFNVAQAVLKALSEERP